MNTPSSFPTLSEVFGRKRKKRTSIETNIRLTLEKRFQDVSSSSGGSGWAAGHSWLSGRTQAPCAPHLPWERVSKQAHTPCAGPHVRQ